VDETDRAVRVVGDQVVVRSVSDDDLEPLERLMACPGVRAWWWDFDIGKFALELRDPDLRPMVIEHAGQVVGYMQYSEEASLAYRFAAIDLALHDDHQGRGYGSDAVRTLARYLFETRGHHRLTIDPAVANARAIRCYERVGFRPVGVMRQYERGADGTWHDGLLMELLAGELQ
jgi:aminoglycoside 6'-N-acetyltransferase